MIEEGIINLKTDNEPFYNYSKEVATENKFERIDSTNDLYADISSRDEVLTSIKTHYEKLFTKKGFKICYLKYRV